MNASKPSERLGAVLGVLVAALGIAATISLSALFAQSDQTARTARRGELLQAAEGLLGSTATQRAATSVALLVGDSVQRGADRGLRDLAVFDLRTSTEAVDERATTYATLDSATGMRIESMADEAVTIATEIAELLDDGDLETANRMATAALLPALDGLETAIVGRRNDTYALLQAEKGTSGSMARAASMGVAFLVPAGSLIVYRNRQRRRDERREYEFEVAAERQRRAVKDEMVASLGHELRTPLTGIYGAAMAIQDAGIDERELLTEMAAIIVDESANLSRMVDDLMATARADAGQLVFLVQPTDVCKTIEAVMLAYQRMIDIELECAEALVLCDEIRLRQVIRNLVANARIHGGPTISVTGTRTADFYRIRVTDDGDGLSDEAEARLFERFVHEGTAALTAGSVGLGLAVARQLTIGMGGDLRYERKDGNTHFTVELQLAPPGATEANQLSASHSG